MESLTLLVLFVSAAVSDLSGLSCRWDGGTPGSRIVSREVGGRILFRLPSGGWEVRDLRHSEPVRTPAGEAIPFAEVCANGKKPSLSIWMSRARFKRTIGGLDRGITGPELPRLVDLLVQLEQVTSGLDPNTASLISETTLRMPWGHAYAVFLGPRDGSDGMKKVRYLVAEAGDTLIIFRCAGNARLRIEGLPASRWLLRNLRIGV